MAADKESVELLHTSLCRAFADILDNGVKVKDDEGTVVTLTAPAAYLSVIRQFLKDNEIKAALLKGAPVAGVLSRLPFAGEDDVANQHTEH